MPTKPPHHVSSFIFRISSLGFRISPDPSGRIMRNEPNSTPANSQSPTAKSCFYKTNPICPTPNRLADPKTRNEPNLPPQPPGQHPKNAKRTQKDNARCNRATPIFNPHGSGGNAHDTKNAKRTQFTPTPAWPTIQKCETNPIYRRPTTKMRNKPNLPAPPPSTIYNPLPQSPLRSPLPVIGYPLKTKH